MQAYYGCLKTSLAVKLCAPDTQLADHWCKHIWGSVVWDPIEPWRTNSYWVLHISNESHVQYEAYISYIHHVWEISLFSIQLQKVEIGLPISFALAGPKLPVYSLVSIRSISGNCNIVLFRSQGQDQNQAGKPVPTKTFEKVFPFFYGSCIMVWLYYGNINAVCTVTVLERSQHCRQQDLRSSVFCI